jgi:putative membrane protein
MPSIAIVWVLGLTLMYITRAWDQGWFQAKFLLVVALSGYQGWLRSYGRRLAAGHRPLDNRTLRIMNEIPGIAAAIIVVLVIVKPF